MTVDLSKLRAGDKVKLRCGGEIEWPFNGPFLAKSFSIGGIAWENSGNVYCKDWVDSPFDIIQTIPQPFDWSEVRSGMAFKYQGIIVNFIGDHLTLKGYVVCRDLAGDYNGYSKKSLTRAPEHDMEVKL